MILSQLRILRNRHVACLIVLLCLYSEPYTKVRGIDLSIKGLLMSLALVMAIAGLTICIFPTEDAEGDTVVPEIGYKFHDDYNNEYEVYSTTILAVKLVRFGGDYDSLKETVTDRDGFTYLVNTLGYQAVVGSKNLTEFTVPSFITHIETDSIRGTFESLTIPSTVVHYEEMSINATIGTLVWKSSAPLDSQIGYLRITEYFEFDPISNEIGNKALSGITYDGTLDIPRNISRLGPEAFMTAKIGELNLPNTISTISEKCFYGAEIGSLNCGTVRNVEESAFEKCDVTSLDMPNLVFIGNKAFSQSNLQSFDLPDSLEQIGDYAFANAPLNEIIIPSSVKEMGENALSNIPETTSIEIPPLPNCDYINLFGSNQIFRTASGDMPLYGCYHGYHFFGNSERMTATSDNPLYLMITVEVSNGQYGDFTGNDGWVEYGTQITLTSSCNNPDMAGVWNVIDRNTDAQISGDVLTFTAYNEYEITLNFTGKSTVTIYLFLDVGSTPIQVTGYRDTGVLLPDYERENYDLVGWTKGDSTVYKVGEYYKDFNISGARNDLYAVWEYTGPEEIPKFTISTFVDGEGYVTGSGTYAQGTTITLSATAYNGWQFVRWSDGVTSASRTITVSSDASFTAVFEEIPYDVPGNCTVTFDVMGGSEPVPMMSVAQGTQITLPEYNGTREGYKFIGWVGGTYEPNWVEPVGSKYTIVRDTIIYAVWYEETVETAEVLIFVEGNGSVTGGGIYPIGTQVTLTATADEGNMLLCWADGYIGSTRTITVDYGSNYTARFEPTEADQTYHRVSYDTMGGDKMPYLSVKLVPEGEIFYTAEYDGEKAGYKFAGWIDSNGYSVSEGSYGYMPTSEEEDYVLRANWVPTDTEMVEVTITRDSVGGTMCGYGEYPIGSKVWIGIVENENQVFDRWNDGNTEQFRPITVTDNVEYVAYLHTEFPDESEDSPMLLIGGAVVALLVIIIAAVLIVRSRKT